MIDNKDIEALGNLHNRILGDASFLAKVNLEELTALFHAKRFLELQEAEIEELQEENKKLHKICNQAVKTYKETKIEAIKEYKERVKQILLKKGFYMVMFKNALNEAEKEMVGE